MHASVAAILGELKQIEQRSPEDVAVLMTPLLRALEAVRDGRAPHLDHAQTLAIANSLAQTAARAGDADAAVAIASISSELQQLLPETFAAPNAPADAADPPTRSGPDTAPEPPAGRPRPFSHPYQQLFGILGVGALSYAGYLQIQAHFQPGSLASWLLTVSSSLFAVGVALYWRRFVLHSRRGASLTALALVFALTAGAWAIQTSLTLRPQLVTGAPREGTAAVAATGGSAASNMETAAPTTAPDAAATSATAAGDEAGPIAFWWLGDAPAEATTHPPEPAQHGSDGTAEPKAPQGAEPTPAARTDAAVARPIAARPIQPVDVPPPAGPGGAAGVTPPHRSASPVGRYRDLLDREVVITDVRGSRHAGTLTGVSKHGVTLQMEVDLFGEAILAQRFYLFDEIERLHAE